MNRQHAHFEEPHSKLRTLLAPSLRHKTAVCLATQILAATISFAPIGCRTTPRAEAAIDPLPTLPETTNPETVAETPIKVIHVGGIPEQGLVWLFPGIEGGGWMLGEVTRAFRDAGVRSEMRIFDWYRPFGALANLQDHAANRRRAAQVAQQLVEYHRRFPEAPIDLVGYSGGAGLAVMTVEALPSEIVVRNLILAQPALSPDYDLTPALRRVSGRLINFHSRYDGLTLGWGTRIFGTIDRKYVASAGKDGFDLDKAVADPQLRGRVQQFPWSRDWLRTGHYGLHVCIVFYQWNRTYVAPALFGGPVP